MCVDYTGLNKACIDQIVDSISGCEILSFLDAYSGYHQIARKESDQLAISFITPFGTYCYVTMLSGLKTLVPPTSVACRNVSPIRSIRLSSPTSMNCQNPQSPSMRTT
jgi:hypothetical protein